MVIYFIATVKLFLEVKREKVKQKAKHLETKFNFDVSDNLDVNAYQDNQGNFTGAGIEALTNTLTSGLVASIHYAHQTGLRDSSEHLRYIISELEKGFVEVAKVIKSDESDNIQGA